MKRSGLVLSLPCSRHHYLYPRCSKRGLGSQEHTVRLPIPCPCRSQTRQHFRQTLPTNIFHFHDRFRLRGQGCFLTLTSHCIGNGYTRLGVKGASLSSPLFLAFPFWRWRQLPRTFDFIACQWRGLCWLLGQDQHQIPADASSRKSGGNPLVCTPQRNED